MILLLILLALLFWGGGGCYGYFRWGAGGGPLGCRAGPAYCLDRVRARRVAVTSFRIMFEQQFAFRRERLFVAAHHRA
jgi:hypothetical protein